MRRLAWPFVLASLAATGAFVACTLNPQPLPPGDDGERSQATGDVDAAFGSSDAAAPPPEPETPPQTLADAGVGNGDGDGSSDAGDAGDGGDSGDGG